MGPAESAEWLPFFLSYAHDSLGNDDHHVQQFFHDLRGEVPIHSGVADGRVGFLDSDSLRVGYRWSPELVLALAHCQVFIALCSPRYFARPSCGKEWAVFERRLTDHRDQTGRLIPLFWVPMHDRDLPATAKAYQYRDTRFGPAYAAHGVRDLVRMARHRDMYQDFVTRLARRIVELTKDHRLPAAEHRPEFDSIKPAFGEPSGDPPSALRSRGPDRQRKSDRDGNGTTDGPFPGWTATPQRGNRPEPEPRPILNPNASTRHPPTNRWKRQNDNGAQEPDER